MKLLAVYTFIDCQQINYVRVSYPSIHYPLGDQIVAIIRVAIRRYVTMHILCTSICS